MSDDMQQQFDELKADMRAGFDEMRRGFSSIDRRFEGMDQRFDRLEGQVRTHSIILAKHEEHFVRIDEKLKKLDQLDDIHRMLSGLGSEIVSSRNHRVLSDKKLRDQDEWLTNHEPRIERLERREKPS